MNNTSSDIKSLESPMRYFIGNHSDLDMVEASPAATFADLVHRYIHNPVTMKIDPVSYLAMDEQKKRENFISHFIIPSTFKERRCQREASTALPCNLIMLATGSQKDVSRFTNKPDEFAKLLKPWPYCVYRSPFSTKLCRQFVIVISSDAIPIKVYPRAVAKFANQLQLTSVPEECFSPHTAYPLPILFENASIPASTCN